MAKILAPNKDYTGVSASVSFVQGVGETENPHLISWFERNGYEVIKDKEEILLSKMTHEELDTFASENNVPDDQYPKSGKKEEKVAAIEKFLSGE